MSNAAPSWLYSVTSSTLQKVDFRFGSELTNPPYYLLRYKFDANQVRVAIVAWCIFADIASLYFDWDVCDGRKAGPRSLISDFLFAGRDAFEGNGFEDFIEAVSAKEWEKAGEKLEETRWCKERKERCRSDKSIILEGCPTSRPNVISMVTTVDA
jgi:hypothetical protein